MDYLVHHGIKGQRWGVRRYQNEDGSYTKEGEKRRKRELEKIGSIGGNLNQAKGSVNDVRNTVRDIADKKKQKEKLSALDDAKNMTDEELKERIARLNLENNYVNAISQQQVSNGASTVDTILAVTGTLLGIAATGVGIWATLKK